MTIDELRNRTTITLAEAAEVLSIGKGSAVYRAAQRGLIPGAVRLGGQWRVSVGPLLDYLGLGVPGDGEPDNDDNVRSLRAS